MAAIIAERAGGGRFYLFRSVMGSPSYGHGAAPSYTVVLRHLEPHEQENKADLCPQRSAKALIEKSQLLDDGDAQVRRFAVRSRDGLQRERHDILDAGIAQV